MVGTSVVLVVVVLDVVDVVLVVEVLVEVDVVLVEVVVDVVVVDVLVVVEVLVALGATVVVVVVTAAARSSSPKTHREAGAGGEQHAETGEQCHPPATSSRFTRRPVGGRRRGKTDAPPAGAGCGGR